jgi:hypothetical protein
MSEMSEKARAAAKDKVERLTRSDPHARVDASGYSPDGAMNANAQTGPRVISRRQFRRGGKVAGVAPPMRADRKPRAGGGRTKIDGGLINEDVKEANEEREGTKHVGGFARGGRAEAMAARVHKLIGGALTPQQRMGMMRRPAVAPPMMRAAGGKVHADAAQDKKLIHAMGCKCGKCSGGRVERKDGGGNWIAGAVKHPGALHRELGVPEGKKIPAKKLAKAAHSDNPKLARRANLAETLKGLPHKKDGGAINDGTRPTGGRLARKGGGRAKKGTNVNIIIAPQGSGAAPPMPRPMPTLPGGPVGLHQGAPPVIPPAGVPPAALQGNTMPMRARGGPVSDGKLAKPGAYPIDAGAGGGLGRLEKAERAARS